MNTLMEYINEREDKPYNNEREGKPHNNEER
jgi:hypothetical protein